MICAVDGIDNQTQIYSAKSRQSSEYCNHNADMTKFVDNSFPVVEMTTGSEVCIDKQTIHSTSTFQVVSKMTHTPQQNSLASGSSIAEIQQTRSVETAPIEVIECWNPQTAVVIAHHEEEKDPHGPLQVTRKVKLVMHKWGHVEPINPERFFLKMLLSRGYTTKMIPALQSTYRSVPSPKQIQDYDNDLVHAVKNNDLAKIKALHQQGRSMSACNKFSESVVHMACRRGSYEVADYVLSNGGDCNIVDDYGRTPLHDACWRMEPSFDVVTLLLDKNLDLLRTLDVRGSTPLKYVREDHWIQWCAYIFHQKEKYWLPVGDPTENNKRLRSF